MCVKGDDAELAVSYLSWLSNAIQTHPDLTMIGHGNIVIHQTTKMNGLTLAGLDDFPTFKFSLVKYLMVFSKLKKRMTSWIIFSCNISVCITSFLFLVQFFSGWFLANAGYEIDTGVLDQPFQVYDELTKQRGEPLAPFTFVKGSLGQLERYFKWGKISINFEDGSSALVCKGLHCRSKFSWLGNCGSTLPSCKAVSN